MEEENEGEEVIVTGTRFRENDSDSGGMDWSFFGSFGLDVFVYDATGWPAELSNLPDEGVIVAMVPEDAEPRSAVDVALDLENFAQQNGLEDYDVTFDADRARLDFSDDVAAMRYSVHYDPSRVVVTYNEIDIP